MRYTISEEKKQRLREIDKEIQKLNREIESERAEFFAQLVADGWQRYVAEVRYSSAYDPWSGPSFRSDGDIREDVYYFAPHVQIPGFDEFIQTYNDWGLAELDAFLETLKEEDWYEE